MSCLLHKHNHSTKSLKYISFFLVSNTDKKSWVFIQTLALIFLYPFVKVLFHCRKCIAYARKTSYIRLIKMRKRRAKQKKNAEHFSLTRSNFLLFFSFIWKWTEQKFYLHSFGSEKSAIDRDREKENQNLCDVEWISFSHKFHEQFRLIRASNRRRIWRKRNRIGRRRRRRRKWAKGNQAKPKRQVQEDKFTKRIMYQHLIFFNVHKSHDSAFFM